MTDAGTAVATESPSEVHVREEARPRRVKAISKPKSKKWSHAQRLAASKAAKARIAAKKVQVIAGITAPRTDDLPDPNVVRAYMKGITRGLDMVEALIFEAAD
jgi:hypothetical protein